MLREWFLRGGGLSWYFEEQGLSMGIQECLENFHRGSPTARTSSLLVELIGVAAYPFAGWMCEGGRHRELEDRTG